MSSHALQARAERAELPPLRISETILQTARFNEMRRWYATVLAQEPTIENMPEGTTTFGDGTLRASGMRLCFFEVFGEYPYMQNVGLFEFPGTSQVRTKESPGLHHMQLNAGTIAALVARDEALDSAGIRPVRCMNHGISTSFYYADPDGNAVELTASNWETLADYRAYLGSEAFRRNPSGELIDAGVFRQRFHAGEPLEELRRFSAAKSA